MKPDTSTIGHRLKMARIRSGKDQGQVAHRLRISPSLVSGWETNERTVNLLHLGALCDYLGITPSYLLATQPTKRGFLQAVK